jgi:hypothetical protein
MAKPGEYDFVPLGDVHGIWESSAEMRSVGIFQWIYKADGHGLKKSKVVYRVKGPWHWWEKVNERARYICLVWNSSGVVFGENQKRSETI